MTIDKNRRRNIGFSLYGHAQEQEPLLRGHEIYNVGTPFVGHHYYIPSLSDLCLGKEKKILKEIMHFHYMTHTTMPLTSFLNLLL